MKILSIIINGAWLIISLALFGILVFSDKSDIGGLWVPFAVLSVFSGLSLLAYIERISNQIRKLALVSNGALLFLLVTLAVVITNAEYIIPAIIFMALLLYNVVFIGKLNGTLSLSHSVKWGVFGGFGIALGLLLLIAILDAQDQEINPEALAMMESLSEPATDDANAYYAISAFNASVDGDTHEVGKSFADKLRKSLKTNKIAQKKDIIKPEWKEIEFSGDRKLLCDPRNEDCSLEVFLSKNEEIQQLWSDNSKLATRYTELLKYRDYEFIIKPERGLGIVYAEIEAPDWNNVLTLQLLYLNHLATQLASNGSADATSSIESDVNFWRMILEKSEEILSREVAIAALTRDFIIISEMVRAGKVSQTDLPVLNTLLTTFSQNQLSAYRALRREAAWGVPVILDLPEGGNMMTQNGGKTSWIKDSIANLFYQPQATVNINYDLRISDIESSKLPAYQIVDYIKNNKSKIKTSQMENTNLTINPVNFSGRILIGITNPDYSRYMMSAHNLDALRRLVFIQLEIAQRQLARESIEMYLDTLPDSLKNPFTADAPAYNAETRTLSFKITPRDIHKEAILGNVLKINI